MLPDIGRVDKIARLDCFLHGLVAGLANKGKPTQNLCIAALAVELLIIAVVERLAALAVAVVQLKMILYNQHNISPFNVHFHLPILFFFFLVAFDSYLPVVNYLAE